MAVTTTIQNVKPVVGASADVWGGILNDRVGETYTDINALAALANANETGVAASLKKAGDTATGDIVLADVAQTSPLSAGFRGVPVVSVDVDRTFIATDAGKMIRLTGAASRTWTIPPNSSVAFPVDTTIVLRNFSSASLNVVRGSGVELRIAGSATNANRTVTTQGLVTITQEAANVWVMSGVGGG